MKTPRDSQQTTVYNWGWALAKRHPQLGESLTIAQCESLVCDIWSDYRADSLPPIVAFPSSNNLSALGKRWKVSLPPWARTPLIVLHELAHALLDGGEGQHLEPDHGPIFVKMYCDLLEHYGGIDIDAAKRLAPSKMRISSAAASQQRVASGWKQWRERVERARARLAKIEASEPSKYRKGR